MTDNEMDTLTEVLHPGPVCTVCPIRRTCRRICTIVEAEQLPSMERGRLDSEDLPRLFMGMRMTRALLDNEHMLTPNQRKVVRLYYRESLRQSEIARRLDVSQQAVNDSLQRSRATVGKLLVGRARPT